MYIFRWGFVPEAQDRSLVHYLMIIHAGRGLELIEYVQFHNESGSVEFSRNLSQSHCLQYSVRTSRYICAKEWQRWVVPRNWEGGLTNAILPLLDSSLRGPRARSWCVKLGWHNWIIQREYDVLGREIYSPRGYFSFESNKYISSQIFTQNFNHWNSSHH